MDRAQGTTEYLILLAVILLIGIIAIGFLSFVPGTSSDTKKIVSDTYWRSARPVGIFESRLGQGGMDIVLQNNEADDITVTGVEFENQDHNWIPYSFWPAEEVPLSAGERKTRTIDLVNSPNPLPDCSAGSVIYHKLAISYRTKDGTVGKVIGDKELSASCTTDIICLPDNQGCPGGSGGACIPGSCEGQPGCCPICDCGDPSLMQCNIETHSCESAYPEISCDDEGNCETTPSNGEEIVVEEEIFEGTLEVWQYDDFERQISGFYYILKTDDGNWFYLDVGGEEFQQLQGSRIRVHGIVVGNTIVITGDIVILQETQPQFQEAQEAQPQGTPAIARQRDDVVPVITKKLAVILFNFQNDQSQPVDPESIRSDIFTASNSVRAYYLENSYGQLVINGRNSPNGEIYGWYTIPYDSTVCSWPTWIGAAYAAAIANGTDLSGYTNYMFISPPTSCGFVCVAEIGGQRVYCNGMTNKATMAHELGHNFGLYHANMYFCYDNGQRVAINSPAYCSSLVYGDIFDVMGATTDGIIMHMNTINKDRLSWLRPANKLLVTTSGTYTIFPIEQPSAGVQELIIPWTLNNHGQISSYLHLEYRKPYSIFEDFDGAESVLNGIFIRTEYSTTAYPNTHLFDSTPLTPTFVDAALHAGESLHDSLVSGVTITHLAVADGGTTVSISFGPRPCTPILTAMSVFPQSQGGLAGQSFMYTVNMTNNDIGPCPASTFTFETQLPYAVWSAETTPPLVTLSPGESYSTSLSVHTTPGTPPGSYPVWQTILRNDQPGEWGAMPMTVIILLPNGSHCSEGNQCQSGICCCTYASPSAPVCASSSAACRPCS